MLRYICVAAVLVACKGKPRVTAMAEARASNLVEVGGSGGNVEIVVTGAAEQPLYIQQPSFSIDGLVVTPVPLVPAGADVRVTFRPNDAPAREVRLIAGTGGEPGVATLALLDQLAQPNAGLTPPVDRFQADSFARVVATLPPLLTKLRPLVVTAQTGSVKVGSDGGTDFLLDGEALVLLDGAITASREPVLRSDGSAGPTPDAGLALLALSQSSAWFSHALVDGLRGPPARSPVLVPFVGVLGAAIFVSGVAVVAGVAYLLGTPEQRQALQEGAANDLSNLRESLVKTLAGLVGANPDDWTASAQVTEEAIQIIPPWQTEVCDANGTCRCTTNCGGNYVCASGRCCLPAARVCGGSGCCEGTSCRGGVCRTAACADNAGRFNEACCSDGSCLEGNCVDGTCQACGSTGWPCCNGNCFGGSLCQSNTCVACGGQGQPCCPGDVCNGSNQCLGGSCQCVPGDCGSAVCGDVDVGCGLTTHCGDCMDPGTYCAPDHQCAYCGMAGEPCCDGNVCYDPNTCGGGGVSNTCGCTPTTCGEQGVSCGSFVDSCGVTHDCGTCPSDASCETCCGNGCCDTPFGVACGPGCINLPSGATYADCQAEAAATTEWPGCGSTFWVTDTWCE